MPGYEKKPTPALFFCVSRRIKYHSRKQCGLFFPGTFFSLSAPSSEGEEKYIIIL